MQEYKIEVQKRELSSKKSFARGLRRNGDIPGIYYSHDSKVSIPFMVTQKVLIVLILNVLTCCSSSLTYKNTYRLDVECNLFHLGF